MKAALVLPVSPHEGERLICKKEVIRLVSLSKSQINRLELQAKFPKRIHISPKRVAWSLREVTEWIETRKAERKALTDTEQRGCQ